ncbi:glycosyltransferase family A protein [Thermomonas carbonis]|uniref:Glycosyltransferase family 2 protein n=2 Tax=Thermomonas carbonis TaxID=1463158 RepID=A0A7G9SN40_9GAMM|nr:glycosyltransferase family A protein [Thermomonas carbonis]QNN69265.1 glycosyltransferase family 2 protein [Thermomonas carbonis]
MLRDAVASVLAQTYPRVEVIIVDDGSEDETPKVAGELATLHPGVVRWFRQDNAGPGAARNLGLRHARGEFIQYLDSDDLLEPGKFESQVAALQQHPDVGLAYGITRRVDVATGESRVWARTGEQIEHIFPSFLMKRDWDTNAPLWRRTTCEAIGPWLELRCLEDWEHDLRAGMLGIRAVHVPKPGAIVRDHDAMRASGMTTGFTVEIVRDMARAHAAVWSRMRALDLRDWSYLEEFSRKVFWIARMCGERGLITEADEALEIASEMMTGHSAAKRLRMFRVLVRILGWRRAVALGERAMHGLAA